MAVSVPFLKDIITANKISKLKGQRLKGCFSNCSPQHQTGSALPYLDLEVLILECTSWLQEKDFSKTIIILKSAVFYGTAALYELL